MQGSGAYQYDITENGVNGGAFNSITDYNSSNSDWSIVTSGFNSLGLTIDQTTLNYANGDLTGTQTTGSGSTIITGTSTDTPGSAITITGDSTDTTGSDITITGTLSETSSSGLTTVISSGSDTVSGAANHTDKSYDEPWNRTGEYGCWYAKSARHLRRSDRGWSTRRLLRWPSPGASLPSQFRWRWHRLHRRSRCLPIVPSRTLATTVFCRPLRADRIRWSHPPPPTTPAPVRTGLLSQNGVRYSGLQPSSESWH